MGELSPVHLILVLVIALLVLGPGKLPETGAAIGKAIREFRQASSGPLEPGETTVPAPATSQLSTQAATSPEAPPTEQPPTADRSDAPTPIA